MKEENARQKMLETPCPYCSDPQRFQGPLGTSSGEEITHNIAKVGKFWNRAEGDAIMLPVKAKLYGDRWRMLISGKHFINRFKDFNLEILSFKSEFSPWSLPPPFYLLALTAGPPESYRGTRFNVCRITHQKSPIVVDAHKWWSHEGAEISIYKFPKELVSVNINALKEAMEFFRPETRGAPRFSTADLVEAIKKFGGSATLTAVAKELGVTRQALQFWARRSGMESWNEVMEKYKDVEIW
jgi:hypothetical protein